MSFEIIIIIIIIADYDGLVLGSVASSGLTLVKYLEQILEMTTQHQLSFLSLLLAVLPFSITLNVVCQPCSS